MNEDSGEASDGVLPPEVDQLLGLAWILLFAGRWIAVQFLLAARILSSTAAADLDDRVLTRLYLVLLAVTVIVVALRAMRGVKRKLASKRDPTPVGGAATPDSASSVSLNAADRRPDTGD